MEMRGVRSVLLVARDPSLIESMARAAGLAFPSGLEICGARGFEEALELLKQKRFQFALVGQIDRVRDPIPGSLGTLEDILKQLEVPTITFLPAEKRAEVLRDWALRLDAGLKAELERLVPLGKCTKEQVDKALVEMQPMIEAVVATNPPLPPYRLGILDAYTFDIEQVVRLLTKKE